MPITTTINPPLASDTPAEFDTKAFAAWQALNTWAAEANALLAEFEAAASAAATAAANAALASKVSKAGDTMTGPLRIERFPPVGDANYSLVSYDRFECAGGGEFGTPTYTVDFGTNASAPVPAGRFLMLPRFETTNGAILNGGVTADALTLNAGAFGYGAGAGQTGTVASGTVPINKPNGLITLNTASLAAGAHELFNLTNTFISVGDHVLLTVDNSSFGDKYRADIWYIGTALAGVRVTNVSASARGVDTLTIRFAVIKGSTT